MSIRRPRYLCDSRATRRGAASAREGRRRGHDQRSESSVELLTDPPFGSADDVLGGVIRCERRVGRLCLPPEQICFAGPAGGCVAHQQSAGRVHGHGHAQPVGVSDGDGSGALVIADGSGHFGAHVHGERVVRHDAPPTEVRTRPPYPEYAAGSDRPFHSARHVMKELSHRSATPVRPENC
jgi:hypothetical protein